MDIKEIPTFTIYGELTDLNTYINQCRKNRFAGAKSKKENTENVMWQTKYLEKITKYPTYIHIAWYTKNKKKDPDNHLLKNLY
jgi:REP element-mobilizing transposase RayT